MLPGVIGRVVDDMASPQKENGFTAIANEILEQIAMVQLNGTQRRIIDIIWRYTYGFGRKDHALSESFIAKATDIHKKQVQRELNELVDMKFILVVKEASFSSSRVLKFNKDYDSWQVTKKIPGNQKDTHTGSGLVTYTGSGLVTQERKLKENNKEIFSAFFESIWALYPNKKGKGQISDAQKKKLQKIGIEEITRCIERYKQSKEEWKQWQNGSTFFNSGYIDYLDTSCTTQLEPEKPQYRDLSDYEPGG